MSKHSHCCSEEEDPKCKSQSTDVAAGHDHGDHDHDGHDHDHGSQEKEGWLSHWPLLTALLVIIVMMVLEYGFHITFSKYIQLAIFVPAYLLAGYDVLLLSFRKALRLDFFNEFFLMSVATIGAFTIGAYSEGVAVMVFYSIGEWFQDAAVSKAKHSIKALLDIRPDSVNVIRSGKVTQVAPSEVDIDEIIQIKAGEKVALDGILHSEGSSFNTAALTGESKPDSKNKGDQVFAGMINLNQLAEVQVKALFKDSKLSKILEMVQDATARKSQTQLFISRFAKVYTPIVFLLAFLVVVLPMLFLTDYSFKEWFYRGLVFLVISCPCALVVSIPLGYFGGIGLASRNGILFKGSNFLDVMTRVDTVVMDKTGTLTKGIFKVQQIHATGISDKELVRLTAILESKSTHPIATAILQYAGTTEQDIKDLEEIPGHGLSGKIDGREVMAGNTKLLTKFGISYPDTVDKTEGTVVVVAIDRKYAGYITIADELKEDAAETIKRLRSLNILTVILSGDKQSVVDKIAAQLGIDRAFGDLLPEDKVHQLELVKKERKGIAFVGDGINDSPVIALADAGMAMGGLGSDAAIETADIVIQNDQPSKIVDAIKIGKLTRNVVWQNIVLAMSVKLIVLGLGAGGVATLWEAVIADVGVALLAILNAVRIQNLKIR
ncbi:cation-transporting ATPase [Pedobacter sp. BAL39]|uniref:heavy metal translocating P-type ATPase n=1 Tax=Pedobacter sp. BAL39 TaxID=391596 RepID=UPI0001559501|nr:heavy metal translocating P-type ATPase [Pedobacter sp. BAL39]EDM36886.1 cation-transporting ATPase [Pedobacter sp. BAL39]